MCCLQRGANSWQELHEGFEISDESIAIGIQFIEVGRGSCSGTNRRQHEEEVLKIGCKCVAIDIAIKAEKTVRCSAKQEVFTQWNVPIDAGDLIA